MKALKVVLGVIGAITLAVLAAIGLLTVLFFFALQGGH